MGSAGAGISVFPPKSLCLWRERLLAVGSEWTAGIEYGCFLLGLGLLSIDRLSSVEVWTQLEAE